MDIKSNLAQNIAYYRKHLKLTQLELAEKLNYSDKAVSKWERAEAVPEITVLKQLADFFGVTIDTLIKEPKKQMAKPLQHLGKKRVTLALWATAIVWLVATFCYVFLGIVVDLLSHAWLAFVFAVPISLIVLLVLTSVWGKNWFNFTFSSLLVWTTCLAFYLLLLLTLTTPPAYLWMMFLICIPLNALLIFLFMYKRVKKI